MNEIPKKDYRLNSLYINVTGRCNLRCRHCWVSPVYSDETERKSGELTPDEIISIIKEARPLGLRSIKLTGGEPLLRDDLEPIFEFCLKGKIRIIIETNGTLIDEEKARLLKKYKISFISVSLDGYNSLINDSFRGVKGAFNKAIEGIRDLIEAGFNPQVITCLHKENAENFDKLIRLFIRLGVKDVKINPIMPVGRGDSIHKEKRGLTVKEILYFKNRTLAEAKKRFPHKLFLHIPPAFLSLKEIKGRSRCNIFGILGVLPDGYISICGIGFQVKELLFGKFNNGRAGLRKIWYDSKKLNELRRSVPEKLEGVCFKCMFKKFCLGSCRAEAYYRDKNFCAPFWFCQQAYEQGLFPESRLIPRRSYGKIAGKEGKGCGF